MLLWSSAFSLASSDPNLCSLSRFFSKESSTTRKNKADAPPNCQTSYHQRRSHPRRSSRRRMSMRDCETDSISNGRGQPSTAATLRATEQRLRRGKTTVQAEASATSEGRLSMLGMRPRHQGTSRPFRTAEGPMVRGHEWWIMTAWMASNRTARPCRRRCLVLSTNRRPVLSLSPSRTKTSISPRRLDFPRPDTSQDGLPRASLLHPSSLRQGHGYTACIRHDERVPCHIRPTSLGAR